jgi:Protein of unknown function (DUF3180)
MRRTGPSELVTIFAVVIVVSYLLLLSFYDSLPPIRYYTALPIAVLAVIEVVLARRVRAAVGHDPDAKVMAAIAIARLVALGRASALAAAAVCGALVALIVRVAPRAGDVRAASNDLHAASVILAACVLLLGAGLFLEAAGIDPQRRGGSGPPVGNR